MRKSGWLQLAVLLVTVLVVLSAVAADKSASVSIGVPLQLNGQQIDKGDYKVRWTGNDDALSVKIMAGKREVASGSAKMVELGNPAPFTGVVFQDGKLKGIDFAGKKAALVFAD